MSKIASDNGKTARIIAAAEQLKIEVDRLDFSAFSDWVYNPLDYAWKNHRKYISTHFQPTCRIVFVGMNPGPWGMAQTGIPFGEVSIVRDWLGINEKVGRPTVMHPKRPIQGMNCTRSEVSGRRFWGLFKQQFGSAARFFTRHFVISYCPLAFMRDSGANVTPDKLTSTLRVELQAVCDRHLSKVIEVIQPECIIGVGNWAEQRCEAVIEQFDHTVRLGKILHPSPASPAANKNWSQTVLKQLKDFEVW